MLPSIIKLSDFLIPAFERVDAFYFTIVLYTFTFCIIPAILSNPISFEIIHYKLYNHYQVHLYTDTPPSLLVITVKADVQGNYLYRR